MSHDLPLYRLYLLRAAYLLAGGGLLLTIWPLILMAGPEVPRMTGVAWSMLGGIGLLSLLGLRYPLQMLPVLLLEIIWKAIWLGAYALPLWLSDKLTEAHAQTVFESAFTLILLPLIPWDHVWRHYVTGKSDRWTGRTIPSPFRKSGT